MKRLTTIAVMLAVMASCTKATDTASVSFNLSSGTKATIDEVVSQSLSEIGTVSFQVTDANGEKHNITAGQTITIPVGETSVEGWHIPDTDCYFNSTRITTTPAFSIDTTLVVHSYMSNITLKAHYDCAMVIPDGSVKEVRLWSQFGDDLPVPLNSSGAFFFALRDDCELYVIAKENTDYADRNVKLKVGDIEDGHYYTLSPTGVTEGQSSFGYVLESFAEGGEL